MKWEKGFGVKLVPSYVLSGPRQRFVGNGVLLILVCRSRGSFSTVPSVIVSSFHKHQQCMEAHGCSHPFPECLLEVLNLMASFKCCGSMLGRLFHPQLTLSWGQSSCRSNVMQLQHAALKIPCACRPLYHPQRTLSRLSRGDITGSQNCERIYSKHLKESPSWILTEGTLVHSPC